ncbi:putative RNA-dependent RNA polymerase [Freshwater macrophyte associated partiti-like virus 3]|nr:putative RNA-dependent RNA polymerase [Freshwater macrophyte associated partiti-like virus 3]
MSFGLRVVGNVNPREPRPEFVTYIDPFIDEAIKLILPVGIRNELAGFSRSYYSMQGHIDSILRFDKPMQFAPSDNEWRSVVQDSLREFARYPRVSALSARKDALSFAQVRYHQGTSAGFGYRENPGQYPTHKGPPDGPNAKKARRIASRIVYECKEAHKQGRWNEFIENLPNDSTPDVAFTRTQLAELPNSKVRNVFGECFHYVLLEGLFAQPLIEMFMNIDSFYFIGEDPITGVPRLIDSLSEQYSQFVTIDWSGFDASVQVYEIDLAFDLMESILDFPDHDTRLVFYYVKRLFISRKLASPDGRLFLRYGGVPSGSFFTHIVDSIVNMIRIRYLFTRVGISVAFIRTHGDDGLVVPGEHIETLNDVVAEANLRLWKINIDKSKLVQLRSEIEFLGRTSRSGVSYRDSLKCLRLLLYPEYPVDDPQIAIARLKGIDQDSGHRVQYIPEIYRALKTKYGDEELPLPAKFQRFSLNIMNASPIGI